MINIRDPRASTSDPRGPSGLPTALTPLIGREREITNVLALLDADESRLVTLTGPGGVGKTRLSLEVARRAEADFADGVRLLRLAPVSDPAQVMPALTREFGITSVQGRSPADQLAWALVGRHLLLVLDNFEHLLAEPPVWLVPLLERCPRLKVLVTSRTVLNISGEHRYAVPPLPVRADALDGGVPAAVELFVQRAQAVRATLALDDRDLEVVGDICLRLDGLPLAIELAASRITVLRPAEILGRLTDRFALLSGGQRDAPPRMRTLHDAVAWSYDLLSPDDQWLFRQLSVFNGSFSLAAAERVAGDGGVDVMAGVESLVDGSLLEIADDIGDETRYFLLETMREFGVAQLEESGEEHAARDRMAEWCREIAREGSTQSLMPADWQWLDRLDQEVGHLRSTLGWLAAGGRMAEVSELVTRLRWVWFFRGREREGLQWLRKVLAWHEAEHGERPVDVLTYAGQFGVTIDDPEAEALLLEAVKVAGERGDVFFEAEARFYLGGLLRGWGQYAEARSHFQDILEVYREIPVPWRIAVVTFQLGVLAVAEGELDEAEQLLERAVAEAVPANRIIPAMSRASLALIACERGDIATAVERIQHRSDEVARIGYADYQVVVDAAATVASACGQHELAARLFGAAASTGMVRTLPERSAFERAEQTTRRSLGEEAFARAWEAGRRLPPQQIDREIGRLAAAAGPADAQPERSVAATAGLTPRELDVLRCLADGMTNRQIADALFISRKTVMNHVASILAKLGLDSRTAAAAFAIRHELA